MIPAAASGASSTVRLWSPATAHSYCSRRDGSEAARTAALAAKQVERFDVVFAEMTQRVDQTLAAAQSFVTGPARQGMAIFAGVSALIDSFRGLREASRRRQASRPVVDEEESLFIG